jgi:hypothetical protein
LRTAGQYSPPGSAPENALDTQPGFQVSGFHAGTGWSRMFSVPNAMAITAYAGTTTNRASQNTPGRANPRQ